MTALRPSVEPARTPAVETLVSVVVPNLNGGNMLLESLRSASGPGVELIVVDNASTDGSADTAASTVVDTVILNDHNEGFAKACNRGADAASGRYVLFLNNDARLEPGALERLVSEAERDDRSAIWQPLVMSETGEVESAGMFITRSGLLWHLPKAARETPYPVFAATGACLLIRRDVFQTVGGFVDEYFAYYEDLDLCWRVRLAGWEVRVVPDAHVTHRRGTTSRRVLRPDEIYYLAYRNRLRTVIAAASARSLIRLLPVHAAASAWSAVAFLGTGRVRPAAAVLRGLLWPMFHAREVRSERRHAQAMRVERDGHLFRAEVRTRQGVGAVWSRLRGHLHRW